MADYTDTTQPAVRGRSMDARSAMLARNWWAMAVRGLIAIIFGVAAFIVPIATLSSLVLLLAIYLLADGLFAIVAGVRAAAHHRRWGLLILEGVVDLAAGWWRRPCRV